MIALASTTGARGAVLIALALAAGAVGACAGESGADGDGDVDSDADSDVDSDVDTDIDADTDTDIDADTDVDSDVDTGVDSAADSDGPAGPVTFTRHTVEEEGYGAAYASVGDVDGDGQLDLVTSHFGGMGLSIPNGEVRVYSFGPTFDEWVLADTIVARAEGVKFPNQTTLDDLDGDGDLDVVVPAGFLACTMGGLGSPCGALLWMEQTASGWNRHDLVEAGSALFYHGVQLVDLDGDGLRDMVTVGEEMGGMFGSSRAVAQWFAGTASADLFGGDPREMAAGLGSFPRARDLDGDGDMDFASAEYFSAEPAFSWLEQTAPPCPASPAGTWVRHVVADDVGPSVMLTFVDDLFGDGLLRAIGTNHTNTAARPPDAWESAAFVFDVPAGGALRDPWPRSQVTTGIVSRAGSMFAPMAAPGIFGVGDIDGDGDLDILLSGDGDPRVLWLEQRGAGSFESHVLEGALGQAGGMIVADLDGDGANELVVTGYEDNKVYVYTRD